MNPFLSGFGIANPEQLKMYTRGVKSFIGKDVGLDELFKAIRTVYSGGIYVTDQAGEIVRKYLSKIQIKPCHFTLTDIEHLLLSLLSKGHSSTEIGSRLCKSPRTVEKHREELYKKFNVENKEQLILEAAKLSLI